MNIDSWKMTLSKLASSPLLARKTRPSDDARRPLGCLLELPMLLLLLTPASSSCAWGDADGVYGRPSHRLHIKIAAAAAAADDFGCLGNRAALRCVAWRPRSSAKFTGDVVRSL